MHMLIVLAAFALAAVTPYMNAPSRSDAAQMADDLTELEQVSDDADDERA